MSDRLAGFLTGIRRSIGAFAGLPWMRTGVLPLVIVLIGGWWFCSLPPSPSSELPSDWTPGGESWTPEWHRLPVAQRHRSDAFVNFTGPADPDRLLLNSRIGQQSSTVEWVDIATGKSLARASDGMGESYYVLDGAQIIETCIRKHDWPILRLRDRETLQITAEVRFAFADGAPPPANFDIQNAKHWRRHNGEWGLHIRSSQVTPNMGLQRTERYYYATPDGQLRDGQEPGAGMPIMDCTTCERFLWPSSDPTHLISFNPGQPNFRKALDLRTEDMVPLPADIPEQRFGPQDAPPTPRPARLTKVHAGRRGLNGIVWPKGECEIVQEYSQPTLFEGRIAALMNTGGRLKPTRSPWWQAPGVKLLLLRRIILQNRFGPAELDLAAARAIRVDAVTLQVTLDGSDDSRLLDSDLRMTAQHELQYELSEALAKGDNQHIEPANTSQPEPVLRTFTDIPIQRSDSGTIMIGQKIHQPPVALTDATAIYRIGVIAPGEAQVKWLGWVPLPSGQENNAIVSIKHVNWTILGESLVLSSGGVHMDFPLHPYRWHQDGFWCAIPLPDELREFREGATP